VKLTGTVICCCFFTAALRSAVTLHCIIVAMCFVLGLHCNTVNTIHTHCNTILDDSAAFSTLLAFYRANYVYIALPKDVRSSVFVVVLVVVMRRHCRYSESGAEVERHHPSTCAFA
jgi:hypothetical protein